jgi:hypothetical protein
MDNPWERRIMRASRVRLKADSILTAHHAFNPIFGIVGPLLQLVGAAIVATANRRGEPDRKNAVKQITRLRAFKATPA